MDYGTVFTDRSTEVYYHDLHYYLIDKIDRFL